MRSSRQFLFLVLIVGLLLMRETRIAPLDATENAFAGWLSLHSQREPASAPLALVEMTDDDLRSMPWPWTPLDFSLFFNAALPFSPPVLALEPILAWQQPDAQQLAVLHNQILRAPKVLLGSELGFADDPSIIPALQETPVLRHTRGDIGQLAEYTLVSRQPAEELRLAGTLGFENLAHTPQPIRQVPLVFRYRGQVVPSFVLQAAMLWYGVTPDEVTVVPGAYISLGKIIHIPVDARGAMGVDFAIPFARFSVGDLLLSAEQSQENKKTIAPVAALKNALTLLARTDKSSHTLQLAGGRPGSIGELFASAIATIQKHEFFRRVPISIEFLIVFEAMILAWFTTRLSKPASFAAGVVTAALYLLLALGIFGSTLIALPLILPLGLIAFVVLFRQLE